jgi:hypothetical protein
MCIYIYKGGPIDPCTATNSSLIIVRVTLQLTVSQSVSWFEPRLGLMTRYLLLLDSYGLALRGGALSDERTGLSFVGVGQHFSRLSVYTVTYILHVIHVLLQNDTIYTRPLSVRARYNRLCPISSSCASPSIHPLRNPALRMKCRILYVGASK